MTSRQKSCVPCAKSKRRCEPQTPSCPRCAHRGLDCYYRNTPVRDFSRTYTQRRVDRLSQLPPPEDSAHFAESGGLTFSEFTSPGDEPRQVLCKEIQTPGVHPAYPVQTAFDKRALAALTRGIMSWPGQFVRKLETPFIHPSLQYAQTLPAPLEGAFSACALYHSRTAGTKDIVLNIIERKVNQLIDMDLSVLPIETHLASLQAFLILHIVQLWDGDVRQRAQAEMHSYVIESWAIVLYMRITEASKKQEVELTWDRWIVLESARRTALMTLMAQGIFEMRKLGVCSYSTNMAEMSFTTVDGPWNAPSPDDWKKEAGALATANYYEYANSWKTSPLPNGPSSFGRLLLTPCLACTPRGTHFSSPIEGLNL
ncbi:hypothetical protein GGR53DRAFT_153497 [Hypoxylon sp. FL1150]|nr:hypothetical protein GGR53DRAFT_153497 [Hypoxylon sp. FL1150]